MILFRICLGFLVMLGGIHVLYSYRRYKERTRIERDLLIPPARLLHLLRIRPTPVVERIDRNGGGITHRRTKTLRAGTIFIQLHTYRQKRYMDDFDRKKFEINVVHHLYIHLRGKFAWWTFTFHDRDLYEASFHESFGRSHHVSVYAMAEEDREAACAIFDVARRAPRSRKSHART